MDGPVRSPEGTAAPSSAGREGADGPQSSEPKGEEGEEAGGPVWSSVWLFLTPDEALRRDQLLLARRAHRPSPRMSEVVLRNLAEIESLLTATSLVTLEHGNEGRWDVWDLMTRVQALLGEPGLAESDKMRLGKAFLERMTGQRVEAVDAAELWVNMATLSDSLKEARALARLLGPGFAEDQAQRYAVRFGGLRTGQRRFRELWAVRLAGPPADLLVPVDDAIRRDSEEKREYMRGLLTPEQFQRLYEELGYDSEEFWRKRLAAVDDASDTR
jgi:hypothetical protein